MDTTYFLNNLSELIRKNKFVTLFFLIENDRANFLTQLKKGVPRILLNPFFAQIEHKTNYEIAEFLVSFLSTDDFIRLNALNFSYNINTENWTTDQRAKTFFGITDQTRDFESIMGVLGGFIGGGSTQTVVSNENTSENKNTIIAIVGIITLVIGFIYVMKIK